MTAEKNKNETEEKKCESFSIVLRRLQVSFKKPHIVCGVHVFFFHTA